MKPQWSSPISKCLSVSVIFPYWEAGEGGVELDWDKIFKCWDGGIF